MSYTEYTDNPFAYLSWWALSDNTAGIIAEEQAEKGIAFAPQDALIVHIEPELLVPHLINVFDATIQTQQTVFSEPDHPLLTVPPLLVAESAVGVESDNGEMQDIPILVLGKDPYLEHHHLYTRARLNAVGGVNRLLRKVRTPEEILVQIPPMPPCRNVIQSV